MMNNLTKKLIACSMAFTLSIGVVMGTGLLPKTTYASEGEKSKNVITVSGEAKIKVKPDIAYVTVGVETNAKTAEEAKNLNAKSMNKIIDALKKMKIDSKDMKTSDFSIYPKYQWIEQKMYTSKKQQLTGYEVNNNLDIKVRDIKKVSEVIDTVTKSGANKINGVRFGLVDQTKIYNEALGQALLRAKSKAEALASVISVNLNKPSKINEQSSGGYIERYSNMNVKLAGSMDSGNSTPIESGELEISARVSVEYEY